MATKRVSTPLIVALTVLAFALVASTIAATTVTHTLTATGTITTSPNLDVFSDAACTNPITNVNWGSTAAGSTATQTVYLKNIGTGAVTLNMTVGSWSPAGASSYMTVTWNKEASVLTAGQSTAATLSLTVSSSITGITTFSHSVTFSGTN